MFGVTFVLTTVFMFLLMLGMPNWGSAGVVQFITAVGGGKPITPPICAAVSVLAWIGEPR